MKTDAILKQILVIDTLIDDIQNNNFSKEEKTQIITADKIKKNFLEKVKEEKIIRSIYSTTNGNRYGSAYEDEKPVKTEETTLATYVDVMSVKPPYAKFLFLLINRLKGKTILEIGTGFGISTMYLLQGVKNNKNGEVITIEKSCKPFNYYHYLFSPYTDANLRIIHDGFENVLDDLLKEKRFDIIFHDARHWKESLLPTVKQYIHSMPVGGILVLDDIYWSGQMGEAWKEIIKTYTNCYIKEVRLIKNEVPRFGVMVKCT